MRRIREIFLTQYIGAIVVGMLLTQAAVSAVSLLTDPIIWYQQANSSRSVMSPASPLFPWSNMIPLCVRLAVYLATSYLLIAWLYGTEVIATDNEDEEPQELERSN